MLFGGFGAATVLAVALVFTVEPLREHILGIKGPETLKEYAKEHGAVLKWHQNSHTQALAIIREKTDKGGEAGTSAAQQLYDD